MLLCNYGTFSSLFSTYQLQLKKCLLFHIHAYPIDSFFFSYLILFISQSQEKKRLLKLQNSTEEFAKSERTQPKSCTLTCLLWLVSLSLKHSLFLPVKRTWYDIHCNMINSSDIFTKSLLDYICTLLKKKKKELQARGWLSYSILKNFRAQKTQLEKFGEKFHNRERKLVLEVLIYVCVKIQKLQR